MSEISSSPSQSKSGLPSDQISFKKPIKIKNELNSQRRNALKEFYKLQQEEKQLNQKSQTDENNDNNDDNSDDELENEVLQDKPVKEIDIINSDFKDILIHTNRLSSSINLINSSIKNIIYNNYYELIKLNDFLKDLNDLDLTNLKNVKKQENKGILELFKGLTTEDTDANDDNEPQQSSNFKEIMEEIEKLDKVDFLTNDDDFNDDNLKLSNNLLNINSQKESNDELENFKSNLKEKLDTVIEELKDKEDKIILFNQLQEIKTQLNLK
ncbi:hypothetical protein WICMUC_001526 [Wickerhamomyces mucosus]|uniref:Vacuolar protein sorting-associated protein 51 homolog n=1 Tax=Wickerhamomyces mucosus TaxID=1378264 RepID=A0A9P8PWF4_9ASCO|nr:hypothetical protein WICMUC_001526 [Wickerhamomyces mucosus]